MIAVLIGIIFIFALIAVIIVSACIGIFLGVYITVDDLMDDPYLRVAALRSLDNNDNAYYTTARTLHGIVKDIVNDKL